MNDRIGHHQLRSVVAAGAILVVCAASLATVAPGRHAPAGAVSTQLRVGRADAYGVRLSATIVAVEQGRHDVVSLASGARTIRVVADRARIVVPEGAIHVVGTVRDLGAGQHVTVVLEPGVRGADEAAAASIMVGAARSTTATG